MDRKEADEYAARLETMHDIALKTEWDRTDAGEKKLLINLEMAKRFRNPSPQQSYYINKLLGMPEQFMDAYYKKEWFRAMKIYDDSITIGMFLEIPIQLRREFYGYTDDDEREIVGMIPRKMVDQVYLECLSKNRLGYECTVYRIPGEIGFYGAKPLPGTRHMAAEENPSYRLREKTCDGQN